MNSTSLPRLWLRLLTFRATFDDYSSLNAKHLLAALVACWLVGIGRYWDDPRATVLQHAGVGSVIYVFVLAAVLWIIVKPLFPERFTYLGVLSMVSMTAPPAALYAIPVEKWTTIQTANQLNLCFLGIVALWRLSLWIHYLTRFGWFTTGRVIICGFLPIGMILAALVILNLHHVVVDVMGGIREAHQSSQDVAYQVMSFIAFLAIPVSLLMALAWLIMVALEWTERYNHRQGRTNAP